MTHKTIAKNVLCIGGSTINKNTYSKINKAIQETYFLEDWSVIVANHRYFRLTNENSEEIKEKIKKDFQGVELVFVYKEQESPYFLEKGKVYILVDPYEYSKFASIYTELTTQNGLPVFKVIEDSSDDIIRIPENEWTNSLDAYGKEREDYPNIDQIMTELAALEINTLAGIILCGLNGDGAYGLKNIVEKGGIVAAQNPKECFNSIRQEKTAEMPECALKLVPSCNLFSLNETDGLLSFSEWLLNLKNESQ